MGLAANVIDLMGGTNNGRTPALGTYGRLWLGGGSIDEIWNTNYTSGLYFQKMLGKHTIKAGVEIRRYHSNEETGGDFGVSSDNSTTSYNLDTTSTSGDSYASYLLGVGTWGGGEQYTGPCSTQAYKARMFRTQIKFTKKLSVNAGIRWDYEPPRTERWNREVFWDRSYNWNVSLDPGWSWAEVEQQIGFSMPEPQWMTNGIHGRMAEMGTPEYPETEPGARPTLPLRPAYRCRLPNYSQDRDPQQLRAIVGHQDRKLVHGFRPVEHGLRRCRSSVAERDGDGGLTYLFNFPIPCPAMRATFRLPMTLTL